MAHPLVSELSAWFTRNGRELPWRLEHPGPWGILVVEVMSQQTPIHRVEPLWTAWMERWPTARDVARASRAEIIRAWGHLGYPRRSLNLQETARIVWQEHGGQVPTDEQGLLELPGIGPYTAAAVLAFGHGRRATVLDTNIRRVLTRTLEGVAAPPAHVRAAERERASALVPEDPPAATLWNAAVMEFGALVCTARAPLCEECPVTSCLWREREYPRNGPERRSQPWQGTIRQLRGAIMAQARNAQEPLTSEEVHARVQAEHSWASHSAIEEALAGLTADALLEAGSAGEATYRLPH